MRLKGRNLDITKLSMAGVLVTLGIVFGELGTSPLYVMKAILKGGTQFSELLIYGSLSLIFWTLTLQTTTKYILIATRVDNRGEEKGNLGSYFNNDRGSRLACGWSYYTCHNGYLCS
jgi:K+ transporter